MASMQWLASAPPVSTGTLSPEQRRMQMLLEDARVQGLRSRRPGYTASEGEAVDPRALAVNLLAYPGDVVESLPQAYEAAEGLLYDLPDIPPRFSVGRMAAEALIDAVRKAQTLGPTGVTDVAGQYLSESPAEAIEWAMGGLPMKTPRALLKAKKQRPLDFSQDDLIEQAEKQFGITYDWNEAGYLTPHGDLLDFSGKAQGGGSGVRHMDHREISSLGQDMVTGEGPEMLRDATNDLGSSRGYMIDFINRGGAMRIMKGDPSTLSIDYGPFPTARQKQMVLKEAKNAEYVAIDQIGEDGYPIRRFSKDFPLSSDIAQFLDESTRLE